MKEVLTAGHTQPGLITRLMYRVINDDMARHSLFMVIFSLVGGLFNLLFQFSMGFMLSPVEYGTFFSLTSLLAIFAIFCQAFQISTAKFVSKFGGEGQIGAIKYIWHLFLKRPFVLGAVLFMVVTLFSPQLSDFLQIYNRAYLIVTFASILFAFILHVNWGVLQGLQSFVLLGYTTAMWGALKLVVALVLVTVGAGIYGGLAAIPIAYLVVFILTLWHLRKVSRAQTQQTSTDHAYSYAWSALVTIFAYAVITNIDVVLAKHFLTPVESGDYAIVALLGRVILFIPMGIAMALFPKVSFLFESGKTYISVLWKGTLATVLLSGVAVLIYWLFPDFIVTFVLAGKYPAIGPYLPKYGVAMGLFSLSFLMMNYFLALNRTGVAYAMTTVAVVAVSLIWFFNSSIDEIINVILICGVVSVILLLPFFRRGRRTRLRSVNLW